MEAFLKSLQLEHLAEIFRKQEVTLKMIPELTHDNLKDMGISKFGHRHKLLKVVSDSNPIVVLDESHDKDDIIQHLTSPFISNMPK